MRKITLSNGTEVEVECLSCAITGGMIEPDGGVIIETEHFHAHQDVAYPIAGLVILASKRHFKGVDEMSGEEKLDYITILSEIRKAQREILGIDDVYYFYNEDTTHLFHTWMVPRYEWMYAFGRSVESVRPVLLHAKENRNENENKEVMDAIEKLRNELNT